ncbi:probable serine/threonine-protein kinase kinX isoform X2 [Topomyia yanbarensis]|uniref:probable serine/threonine-protein kinase kinX isoform X2 n=1 Tax=Topomyia yanbarensis TaxID=2498891 RepID=UPI00273A9C1A|nr:probable serine/threonine-protein kinase kinX isoform X2 [Topomyia yanbarensis]
MSNFAWVTLATNDSYSLGALVVAHSLKRVHTAHQLAVLITPGVSEAMKTKLRAVFNVVEEVNLLDSKDEANLALLKRPELGITFTKLHCWRLVQFEKCVFLDADTLVLRNCDELFEREELSAAPDVGWPDCFNSGVYVYRPSMDTFSSLLEFAVQHGSFDGGDQGLLNSYFSDWATKDISRHLPFVYNTSSVASYSYLPAFKQFGQNTKILHFIGTAKPWLQNFNSETRTVHTPGGFQHLANFLQYWWDIFCEDIHSRLSSEMSDLLRIDLVDVSKQQQVFRRWIKPGKVSSSSYRSTGTDNFSTHGHSNGGGGGFDVNGNSNPYYQQYRDEFVVTYDISTEYVDPWEEYLLKQEQEREQRARQQQKLEEERLYYQYLDNQRLQEQQQRNHELWLQQQQQHQQPQQQHDHAHHQDHTHQHHHEHHDHYHDANVFQSTEQWVEHVNKHDQGGHWEPGPLESGQVEAGGGDGAVDHSHEHQCQHHHQQQQPPQEYHHHSIPQEVSTSGGAAASVDVQHEHGGGGGEHHHQQQQHQQQEYQHDQSTEHGNGSGLAGALSQLHLGEPKSVEQEAYEEHMRRQCWEQGNIDYMGRDSFENIWRRIQQTLGMLPDQTAAASEPEPAPVPTASVSVPVSPSPHRRRSSKSRSRSATPKRDPRDRSPTPPPEDKVPVEKKEVLIEATIHEEDDGLDATSLNERSVRCSKLPPPVQYDPTTRATTLTKKVFAGYQQVITTKSPEGKTRTQTKTVYDPSVDDDEPGSDAVDAPIRVATATVVQSEPRLIEVQEPAIVPVKLLDPVIEPLKPVELKPEAVSVPEQEAKSAPPPLRAERKPSPPRRSQKPQMQQVAQESMAGKEPNVEPPKTVRRKRLTSPPASPQTPSPKTVQPPPSPKTATVTPKTPSVKKPSSSTKSKQSAATTTTTPKSTTNHTSPSKSASSTTTNATIRQSLPTALSKNHQKIPKTLEELEAVPLTASDELPAVPPRRKRESKVARIAKFFRTYCTIL